MSPMNTIKRFALPLLLLLATISSQAQTPARPAAAQAQAPKVTSPMQQWGHNVGDDYFLAN